MALRRLPAPASRARTLCAVVAVLVSSLAVARQAAKAGWDLTKPAPAIAIQPSQKDRPAQCASCHAAVVEEWASTAHAVAWLDEDYQKELADKRKPETCYGCHIPKPLLQGKLESKPAFRDDDRHLGITCESCHLGPDGKMLGPRGTPTSAHPSQVSSAFVEDRSNALCASCHRFNIGPVVGIAKDFEQGQLAARGMSCLGCHAADVEMQFASASGGEDPPVRKGKSHAIQTPRDPAFLRRAFELAFQVRGAQTVVTVENRAGHRVPGLIGRWIEFEARGTDAQGKALGAGKLKLDTSAYLPLDKSLEIVLEGAAASVHVTGRHFDPRAKEPVVFVDVDLPATPR
jgi:hypothetical protein